MFILLQITKITIVNLIFEFIAFFESSDKRKVKRFKIAEDLEKSFQDGPSQIQASHNEVVKEEEEPESLMISNNLQNDPETDPKSHEIKADVELKKAEQESESSMISKLLLKLTSITSSSELVTKFTDEEIKQHLNLLGLKSGGRPEDRVQRLMLVVDAKGDLGKVSKKLFAKKK